VKVLYCDKCKDLFKLTSRELRVCKCKRVKRRYCEDHKHAEVSENAVSLKIPNNSIKEAITRMKRLNKSKPKSTDADYQQCSAVHAWVRPNSGPGNPHTSIDTGTKKSPWSSSKK
jgi:hypothetical protein